MEITEKQINGIVVVKLKGRLDASTTSGINDKVRLLIKERHINLVLDMDEVNFIDSSGLGVLIASLRSVNKVGGNIKVASLRDQVRSVFELTRLHRVFEVFDNSETAVESF